VIFPEPGVRGGYIRETLEMGTVSLHSVIDSALYPSSHAISMLMHICGME
jgi:hypothetical protein